MFADRLNAGKKLAAALEKYRNDPEVVVLGLPRGGVVVAAAVARELKLPLDIIVPRKIGSPSNPEVAIGAIAGKQVYLNRDIIRILGVSESYIQEEMARQRKEAERRTKLYQPRGKMDLVGKRTILVDDGIATGATMAVSVAEARFLGAAKVIVASPVGSFESIEWMKSLADEVVCLHTPSSFQAVGQFYQFFDQTSDEEVIQLLNPLN
ncbi:MAG: phosphoribosyltransferase [Verrucomicrobia bacterium]|nr:phosphoribosyltransferase [Verrucomicrobiota bacterium]